jgi:hypothetical protein
MWQGRRINYRKWSVSHKPVFDGTKPCEAEEEKDEKKDEVKTGDTAMTEKA